MKVVEYTGSTANLLSDDQLREAVAKRAGLDRALTGGEWKALLRSEGYAEFRAKENDPLVVDIIDALVDEFYELQEAFGSPTKATSRPRPKRDRQLSELSSATGTATFGREESLRYAIAQVAAEWDLVQRVRKSLAEGAATIPALEISPQHVKFPVPESVAINWLWRATALAYALNKTTTGDAKSQLVMSAGDAAKFEEIALRLFDAHAEGSIAIFTDSKILRFGSWRSENLAVFPLRENDALGQLVEHAGDLLSSRYGWDKGEAVAFLLAGQVPQIEFKSVNWKPNAEVPALGRITMVLDPATDPDIVKNLYKEERAKVLGYYQPQREKANFLAIWPFLNGPSEKWADRLRSWNSVCEGRKPDWTYPESSKGIEAFRRAAEIARKKLLTSGITDGSKSVE